MAFPVALPYAHEELYGTGRAVSASYTKHGHDEGDLYVTYHFPFHSITAEEFQSVMATLQEALNEYGRENGMTPVSSGSLGLMDHKGDVEHLEDEDEDDGFFDFPDDEEDFGFSY